MTDQIATPQPDGWRRLQAGGRVGAALVAYEGAQKLWHQARSTYHDRFAFTVTVSEDDYLYGDVHEWLLDLMPEETQRALTVATSRSGSGGGTPTPEGGFDPLPFRLLFNDRRRRKVEIAGHRVTVEIQKAESKVSSSREDRGRLVPDAIMFTCHSKAAQGAVLARLREIHDSREKRKPTLRVVSQWGSWVRRADLPERELASVILPADQKAAIVGDLPNEASLIHLLSEVGPRSLLLLEDVDTIQITHERTEQTAQPTAGRTISLSSLLNALDGVATPHGLISVTTTNHFDRLDPALVRAGRMDRIEELTLPTWREVDELWQRFYGPGMVSLLNEGFPTLDQPCALSQAEVSEIFKRHLADADAAARELGDRADPHPPQERTVTT